MDIDRNRMELGRRMLIAAPQIAETLGRFHQWVPEASRAVHGSQFQPVIEDGRLVAVNGALGRFLVAQEFARAGDALFARIVFFEPPTELRKHARELYSIRLFEGAVHFGAGPEPDHFDWDHDRNRWMPRNWLRIGYELAVAVTGPPP